MLVHGWPTEKIPPLNDQISLEAQLYNYTTKKRQISVFVFFKLFFFSPASCHIFCCYIDDWIYSDSSCRRKTLKIKPTISDFYQMASLSECLLAI